MMGGSSYTVGFGSDGIVKTNCKIAHVLGDPTLLMIGYNISYISAALLLSVECQSSSPQQNRKSGTESLL